MKKLNKFFAILVALAMMATLCIATAFAEDPVKSSDPALAVLTKDFQVPAGVTSPTASFAYDFDLQSQPTSATATDTTGTIDIATATGDQTGLLYLKDVFNYGNDAKLAATSMLDQPGEYVFLVTENEANSTFTHVDQYATEAIDYSKAAYTLRVYVARDNQGNLYVKDITVQETTVTPGEEGEDPVITYGNKVDPDDETTTDEHGTPDDTSDDTIIPAGVGSDFVYTNTYSKTLNNDPGDDDPDDPSTSAAVAIKKVVTGSGDTAYAFPFTASITIPEEMKKAEAQEFIATLPDNTQVKFTVAANTTTSDTKDFNLANGQALSFATFPAGATLTVNENVGQSAVQNAAQYTGNAAGLGDGATYAKNAALAYTTAAVNDQGKVTVTNDLDASDITPTGILINNLPYIVLALVAIGGLCAYVIVRRKNEDNA